MRLGRQITPAELFAALLSTAVIILCAPDCLASEIDREDSREPDSTGGEAGDTLEDSSKENPDWRRDKTLRRRPGSYLGGGINYAQMHVWLEENDDHGDLKFGPLHTWGINFRVGDAFTDWFAIGFQILLSSVEREGSQVSMFGLMLDTSFYPIDGLGIRPAVGIGMGFAQGDNDWEMGGGGPGCLSLALVYEIRVTRYFTIAPVVQAAWIVSDGYDGVYLFIGLEFMKWFRTATGWFAS